MAVGTRREKVSACFPFSADAALWLARDIFAPSSDALQPHLLCSSLGTFHCFLLSGSECGGGESADSRLEASEELPSDNEEALG